MPALAGPHNHPPNRPGTGLSTVAAATRPHEPECPILSLSIGGQGADPASFALGGESVIARVITHLTKC